MIQIKMNVLNFHSVFIQVLTHICQNPVKVEGKTQTGLVVITLLTVNIMLGNLINVTN